MNEPFVSTMDLLCDDQAGSGRKRLLDELTDMKVSIKRTMDKGLTPEEMSTAKKLLEAVLAGEQAVDAMWRNVNQ